MGADCGIIIDFSPPRSITSETTSLSVRSLCNLWYSFLMPALSLCVMAWIDSLHTQSQGHHQGLMNERWKGTEVEQRRKREISPQPSPLPHHTCKRLISLLHYQASAAGTGFNSSSSYHWATKMVNLDYLLYLLPNPQYYKYLSCSATWKSDQSREWARWSHTNLLSWDVAPQ